MRCSDCGRDLEVGDRYIQFTMTEYCERNGMEPLDGMDGLFAEMMGSNHGDKIVCCEDCTQEGGDWLLDTVYGDEAEAAS